MLDLCDGSEALRLQLAAVPGFFHISCENRTGSPLGVSIAVTAPHFILWSNLPPLSVPAWGERAMVGNYESPRASVLQVSGLFSDGRDALITRASIPIPVSPRGILKGWGAWSRASAWVPPMVVDPDMDGNLVTRILECHGPLIPINNLPPEYDSAWACVTIPALIAVGPARKDFFTADPDFGRRCIYASRGGSPSSRRALVQVGIAIAKIIDFIDINWELADILTALEDLGRLLPQAGIPASAVSPLVQLLAGVPGRKVEDLDKSVMAALSQGIGRLERLASSGGPVIQEANIHD